MVPNSNRPDPRPLTPPRVSADLGWRGLASGGVLHTWIHAWCADSKAQRLQLDLTPYHQHAQIMATRHGETIKECALLPWGRRRRRRAQCCACPLAIEEEASGTLEASEHWNKGDEYLVVESFEWGLLQVTGRGGRGSSTCGEQTTTEDGGATAHGSTSRDVMVHGRDVCWRRRPCRLRLLTRQWVLVNPGYLTICHS
jgi:hypothetical protein